MLTLINITDILITAVLLYGLIVLIKQTNARKIIQGIGILASIYFLALALNLTLLLSIFRLFLPVFFIALVIIFQDEFKRFFEFLGILPTRYRPIKRGEKEQIPALGEIAQATGYLAKKKMGAIIVLRGNESIGRHLRGGIQLMGVVSSELLESLFDKHTPAHDGAIIINRDIVSQFGARLPLSRKIKELKRHGTRHAAALGISEKTDALVIVVSEEKGTISTAVNGKLKKVEKADDLLRLMSNFYKAKFPEKQKTLWGNIIRSNSRDKVIAVIASTLLWYLFNR